MRKPCSILTSYGRGNFDRIFKDSTFYKKQKERIMAAKKKVVEAAVEEDIVVEAPPAVAKPAVKKVVAVEAPTQDLIDTEQPVKRKPGRPKGSKNKPKDTVATDIPAVE